MLPPIVRYTLALSLLLAGSFASAGSQIIVCIIAPQIKNNPIYFNMPNTTTHLLCELGSTNQRPTLKDLYRAGFKLIDIVNIDPKSANNTSVSPILYLERDLSEANANTNTSTRPRTTRPNTPKKPKENATSGGFFDDFL